MVGEEGWAGWSGALVSVQKKGGEGVEGGVRKGQWCGLCGREGPSGCGGGEGVEEEETEGRE